MKLAWQRHGQDDIPKREASETTKLLYLSRPESLDLERVYFAELMNARSILPPVAGRAISTAATFETLARESQRLSEEPTRLSIRLSN